MVKVAMLPPFKRKDGAMETTKERKLDKLHEQNLRVLQRSRDKLLVEKNTYLQKIKEIDRQLKKYDVVIEGAEKRYQKVMEKENEKQKLLEGYLHYLDQVPTRKRRKKKEEEETALLEENEEKPEMMESNSDDLPFDERVPMV